MFNSRDPSLYLSRSLFFFIQFIISFTGMRHRAFIMGLRLALLVYSNNSNLEMINVSSINSSQWLRRRHRRPPPVLPENEKNQLAWPGLAVSSLTSRWRWRLFTGSRSTTDLLLLVFSTSSQFHNIFVVLLLGLLPAASSSSQFQEYEYRTG